MPYMKSDVEFILVIGEAVETALNKTLKWTHKELQRAMRQDIYNAYSPTDYERTYELLDAWQKEVHMMGSQFEGKIEFDGGMLSVNPDKWQHSSGMQGDWYGISNRYALLHIIEAGYRAYNAKTGKPIPARQFWDKFTARMKVELPAKFAYYLGSMGLKVI